MSGEERVCKNTDNSSPPHQNNVPGLSEPLWPSQSTASADHSYTHTHTQQQVRTSTPPLHATLQHCPNPTADHVLTPYVVKGLGVGKREAERKATCTLCILGRPASVTRHTEAGGQVLRAPLYVSGVVVMGD